MFPGTQGAVRSNLMKNRYLRAQNLKEAKEQIEYILNNLASNPEYSEEEFKICLEHAYHHLNFAWNIKKVDEQRAEACSEDDFKKWSKYPRGEIFEYG